MLPPSMMVSFCGGGGVMTAFVQTKSVAKKIFLALSASDIKTIIFTQFYKMTIWKIEKFVEITCTVKHRWCFPSGRCGTGVPSVISTQSGAQTKPLFSNAWWRLIQSACASNSPPNPQPLIPSLANTCKVTDRGGVAQLNLHSWLKICFSWLCLTIVRVFRLMNYYSVWLWCPVSV